MSVKLVEERNNEIDIAKGKIFDNAGMTFKILDIEDDYVLLVALDENGNNKPYYVVAFLLASDGTWQSGHYFTSMSDASKYFNDVTKSDDNLFGYFCSKVESPEPDHTFIAIYRIGESDPEYYQFIAAYLAKECYKYMLSDIDPMAEEIDKIELGYTSIDNATSIQWRNDAEDFNVYELLNQDRAVIEEKQLSANPAGILRSIGYKEVSNANGEIVYRSEDLYSPDIVIFGNVIEIIPLKDLPISMTIEDHGKMIARLAVIQKKLEEL